MSRDRRSRPPVPMPIGALVEPVYRRVVAQRNRSFDAGRRVERVDRPVISVGNLSVGGTGKTPVVAMVVRMLREAGHEPGIAMRGYKAGAGRKSDEELEYKASCPGTPVAAQPDRVAGATKLIDTHGCSCIVLDDGFQHRFLDRDLDIVLLDATRDVFADRCLPAGWLREPVDSLDRADIAILTHAEGVDERRLEAMTSRLHERFPRLGVVVSEHSWTALIDLEGRRQSPAGFEGETVTLASGIGNPSAFEAMARRNGLEVRSHMIMPDHHDWSRTDLDRLRRAAPEGVILTTRKDWVKIERLNHPLLDRMLVAEVSIALRDEAGDLRDAVLKAAASPDRLQSPRG